MKSQATFRFDLKPEWEEAIRNGKKTIDVRVDVQPFADVKKKDTIRYKSSMAIVKHIRGYLSLTDLMSYEGFEKVVPEAASLGEALRIMRKDFPDEEPAHGYLALEVESLSPQKE